MTQPETEAQSPGPLVNTLPTWTIKYRLAKVRIKFNLINTNMQHFSEEFVELRVKMIDF